MAKGERVNRQRRAFIAARSRLVEDELARLVAHRIHQIDQYVVRVPVLIRLPTEIRIQTCACSKSIIPQRKRGSASG